MPPDGEVSVPSVAIRLVALPNVMAPPVVTAVSTPLVFSVVPFSWLMTPDTPEMVTFDPPVVLPSVTAVPLVTSASMFAAHGTRARVHGAGSALQGNVPARDGGRAQRKAHTFQRYVARTACHVLVNSQQARPTPG
jgi:hypothetical protein